MPRKAPPIDASIPELTDAELRTLSIPAIKARVRARYYPSVEDRKPIRMMRRSGNIDVESVSLRVDTRLLRAELKFLEKQIKETVERHRASSRKRSMFAPTSEESKDNLKLIRKQANNLKNRLIPESLGVFPPSRLFPDRVVAVRVRALLKTVGRVKPRAGWDYSDARPKASQFGKRYRPRVKVKALIPLNYETPRITYSELGEL